MHQIVTHCRLIYASVLIQLRRDKEVPRKNGNNYLFYIFISRFRHFHKADKPDIDRLFGEPKETHSFRQKYPTHRAWRPLQLSEHRENLLVRERIERIITRGIHQ